MKTTSPSPNWTRPYFGLTYYGEGKRRVTVQDFGTCAVLKKWFPGCGFVPEKERFNAINEAKIAGEKWVNNA